MSARGPVLLCFDGSDEAAGAIAWAGRLLAPARAVLLTAWEPVEAWEPYDPGAVLSAATARLATASLGLDEIARDLAQEKIEQGVKLATEAGFEAEGRIVRGKPWRAICASASELDADVIVMGARGLGRVESMLVGSVSASVLTHADRAVMVVPGTDTDG